MRRAGLEPRVAVTEMQIFTNRPSLPNNKTVAEALWLASLLHTSFKSDGLVELITHSALLNHGGGLGKNRSLVYAEPVWWATHLYSSQTGTVPVAVRLDSPAFSTSGKFITRRENVPYVDAAALLDPKTKTLSVFLINRHVTESYTTALTLPGAPPTAIRSTLTANDLLARNTWDAKDAIRPAESNTPTNSIPLPPLSLTRLTLNLK
jgi:alpha-N-arabinofuranosidase